MNKSKKHSPMQSEQGSLVEQIPDDKMAAAVRSLIQLAESKQNQSTGNKASLTSMTEEITDAPGILNFQK